MAAGGCAVLAATLASTPALSRAASPQPSRTTAAITAQIRVNQQGYLPQEAKQAMLMTPRAVRHGTFVVTDDAGHVVLHGRVPSSPTGSWNARFPDVYRLDLSRLHAPGRYRVLTAGPVPATSPWFKVASAGRMFGTLLDDGVAFDQTQRDGRRVLPGPLHRRPSHLLDRRAHVYRWPHMAPGSDLITDRRLHRLAGPAVDVAGVGSTPVTTSSSPTPRRTTTSCSSPAPVSWAAVHRPP